VDGVGVDERNLEAEHPAARLLVDQLGAGAGERAEHPRQVVDLVGDVVHPGPAAGEKPANRRVVAERREQLDPAVADPQRRRLDALVDHRLAVLDASRKQPLVGGDGVVEVVDRDPDVVDAERLHDLDAIAAARPERASYTGLVLSVPTRVQADRVGDVWRVEYEERAADAGAWAAQHGLRPAHEDSFRICLVLVDVQNTFCIPGFELFVAGRTGTGAVDDNRRLCAFVYRNLDAITQIVPTMDTHQAVQIFHSVYLVGEDGGHPAPYTLVSVEDVEAGRVTVDADAARSIGAEPDYAQRHLAHYTRSLARGGKYSLTIWPYHALLGGIGHALVSAVEEAVFFHAIARRSQPDFQVKGSNPLTEHYSVLGPEVRDGPDGDPIAAKNERLVERLLAFDAVVIAGQAKSHCVAWTIDDLLEAGTASEAELAPRVYLLEDCTSPVVVSGVVDYTDAADAAFERFADAGMHVVRSTDPIESWPGIAERRAGATR